MASKTTKLNLHKIDLTDAPPDITVLNQNWDRLDALTAADVGGVSKSGDTITGVLKQVLGENTTSLTATGDGTYLLDEKGGKSAGLILNPTNGTVTFRHHNGTSPYLYNILHTGNKDQIFTYGTSDLTAGSSSLETGKLYFVYE